MSDGGGVDLLAITVENLSDEDRLGGYPLIGKARESLSHFQGGYFLGANGCAKLCVCLGIAGVALAVISKAKFVCELSACFCADFLHELFIGFDCGKVIGVNKGSSCCDQALKCPADVFGGIEL